MNNRVKKNKFLNAVTNIGTWIANFFYLQLFWILYSVKGLLVLGIFPATFAAVQVIYKWFENMEFDFSIHETFKASYNEGFKRANIVGYISLLVVAILYVDLRISNVFIQSIFLHTMLLFFSFAVLSVGLYLFTVMSRYEYSVKHIFKQSFFVALATPINTLAAGVALILAVALLSNFLFLAVFFGVPIILMPIVWFTYSGILAAESKKASVE